ncbi:Nn.00g013520.m01.CDS01 [Neocucurbitaria sp. VM-36]
MSHPSSFSSFRLTYRAIRHPEDLAVFTAINADQAGYQNSNLTNIKLASPADAEKFMKEAANESLLGAIIWLKQLFCRGVVDSSSDSGEIFDERWGTAIGEIHLSALPPHQAHHRWTEIGIDILPAYQGRGYGGEAIEWALEYAFRRAGLHRVKIRAFEWNDRALRLYERVGFKEEGREREALWHLGRWWDGITMGMLEREWRERVRKRQENWQELEEE